MYWLFQPRLIVALVLLAALSLAHLAENTRADDDSPGVRVQNVRRVFDNGEHNAFTDLIRWKGKYWLRVVRMKLSPMRILADVPKLSGWAHGVFHVLDHGSQQR